MFPNSSKHITTDPGNLENTKKDQYEKIYTYT